MERRRGAPLRLDVAVDARHVLLAQAGRVRQADGQIAWTSPPIAGKAPYGIAVRKDSTALRDALQAAFEVVVGGLIVFGAGVLIGSA